MSSINSSTFLGQLLARSLLARDHTPSLMQELLERFSLMGGGAIQQNNDWAAQVPQQLPQKNADLLLSDVVKEE